MAEEYASDESYDVADDSLDLRGDDAGDFNDGSVATGTGRGDPGIDPTEYQNLRAERDRLADRARILDDFERNPEKTLRDVATRMGLDLVPKGSNVQASNEPGQPPREFVNKISRSIPPEYQFLADALASAAWTANQESLRPLYEQQADDRLRSRNQDRSAAVADMDAKYPNWRSSLGDMEELYSFIREAETGSMRHPKFGSLQELLYRLATGDKDATQRATNRMRNAAVNASSRSEGGRESGTDIQALLKNAKTRSERFKLAWNDSLVQHGVR